MCECTKIIVSVNIYRFVVYISLLPWPFKHKKKLKVIIIVKKKNKNKEEVRSKEDGGGGGDASKKQEGQIGVWRQWSNHNNCVFIHSFLFLFYWQCKFDFNLD